MAALSSRAVDSVFQRRAETISESARISLCWQPRHCQITVSSEIQNNVSSQGETFVAILSKSEYHDPMTAREGVVRGLPISGSPDCVRFDDLADDRIDQSPRW